MKKDGGFIYELECMSVCPKRDNHPYLPGLPPPRALMSHVISAKDGNPQCGAHHSFRPTSVRYIGGTGILINDPMN